MNERESIVPPNQESTDQAEGETAAICIPGDAPRPPETDHDPTAPESPSTVVTEDPDAPVAVDSPEDEAAAPDAPMCISADAPPAPPADQDPTMTGTDEAVVSDDPDAPVIVESALSPEQLMIGEQQPEQDAEEARRLAVLEAIVYVTDEPLSAEQIAKAMGVPLADIKPLLDRLVAEYNRPEHGLTVREVAGGYKMATKPEHHEAVRTFVRNLNPPLKLSLAALETLAVIAYKQPITAPEIMEIRGVQGAGVLKTLLDRKLISTAGRKNVVGKPILYKTTKEFLVQFGLRDLSELPTLKEFEDLRRMAFTDAEEPAPTPAATEDPSRASPMAEEGQPAGAPANPNDPASTANE